MASGSQYFTATEVCDIVTAEDEDDPEYIFPGSDDDFDMSLGEEEYDALQREQGNSNMSKHNYINGFTFITKSFRGYCNSES